MKTIWIGVVAACLLSPLAQAQTAPAGTVTVTNVILEGDQVVLQGTGLANPMNCSNGTLVVLGTNAAMRDRFLAAAMTALTAGLKVSIWVTACSGTSWGTAGTAYHLNLTR